MGGKTRKRNSIYALCVCLLLAGCGGKGAGSQEEAGLESLQSTGGSGTEIRRGQEETPEEPDSSEGPDTSEGLDTSKGSDTSKVVADSGTADETFPSGLPQEASSPQITLVMVGDILLHTPVADSGRQEDGTYNFDAIFAGLSEEIAAADLALVNQEVILGGEELGISGYPCFNAPYELGDALVDAGFDVVLHATNHALDKGARGLDNCLAFWEEHYPGQAVLGIHGSAEDQQKIYVYEQEGIRIAILNYTYGTNGIPLPANMPYGVDLLEKKRVLADLERAGELSDFVIVCPHWGTEYKLEASKNQQEWARLFAENGADLVLGTHPHVIEPVEWVEDTLVYYSLGNFVNWTSGKGTGVANRMVGAMAQVTVGLDENGEAYIAEYGVEPVVCHVEAGIGGVTVYPLEIYTQELAAQNEIVRQDDGFSLEYCKELCEKVFGELAWESVVNGDRMEHEDRGENQGSGEKDGVENGS